MILTSPIFSILAHFVSIKLSLSSAWTQNNKNVKVKNINHSSSINTILKFEHHAMIIYIFISSGIYGYTNVQVFFLSSQLNKMRFWNFPCSCNYFMPRQEYFFIQAGSPTIGTVRTYSSWKSWGEGLWEGEERPPRISSIPVTIHFLPCWSYLGENKKIFVSNYLLQV